MSAGIMFDRRREDWRRHVEDLQTRTYDRAKGRAAGEAVFLRAFELTTPIALEVLQNLANAYLGSDVALSVTTPAQTAAPELEGAQRTPTGGLLGSWNLTWPALERAENRLTGGTLPPIQIFAMYPTDFTHGHLALFDLGKPRNWIACWPFQVTTPEDAQRQEPTLAAIAEAEMHERTFAADLNWRLLAVR